MAAIADLQIGMWLGNTNIVRRAVDDLVRRRPLAVLVAGDFIYHWTERDGDDFEPEDVVDGLG